MAFLESLSIYLLAVARRTMESAATASAARGLGGAWRGLLAVEEQPSHRVVVESVNVVKVLVWQPGSEGVQGRQGQEIVETYLYDKSMSSKNIIRNILLLTMQPRTR